MARWRRASQCASTSRSSLGRAPHALPRWRGGRPEIGGKIGDGHVRLMAYGGNHRDR